MFKRIVAIILAGSVLLIYGVQPAFAKSKEDKQAQLTERVKSGISKLGVGQDARVEVKLHDRTKLIGYISEVKNESFTITDPKTSNHCLLRRCHAGKRSQPFDWRKDRHRYRNRRLVTW